MIATQTQTVVPPACCTLEISGLEQKRLVKMFKALGNPIRFEIMKFLVTHPGWRFLLCPLHRAHSPGRG